MLPRIALLALAAPRRILLAAALLTVVLAVFGVPVAKSLSPSGFSDPGSESAHASALLTGKFGQGDVQMLILVSSDDGIDSPRARDVGTEVVKRLDQDPHVTDVSSPWTAPPAAAADLVSRDRTAGLIVAGITGTEAEQQTYARQISEDVSGDRDGVSVRTGGTAMVNVQITEHSQRDLLVMESLAIPLSFLVLVWVFGGLVAAALPVAIGGMAILGALAVLRLVTLVTDVSIFALNLATAMGLALAIDYTLLMLSRYRDELAAGADRPDAIRRTVSTAGRTVLFSATTVALSMAAMVLFPMHFLKSFAYAGVATVAFAAAAAVVVTPAALMLLGDRLDALDVHRLARRILRRPEPTPTPVQQRFWYRCATTVMRRALPLGLAVVVLLLVLGAPFLGVKWGFPDERVLPPSASSHQVGDQLRRDFADNTDTAVTVVVPDSAGLSPADLSAYAAELSRVPDVPAVSAPTGTFVDGARAGPPSAPAGEKDDSVFLTVASTAPLFSDASETQLDRLHAVAGPGGREVLMTGTAQVNRDSVDAITSKLPIVLGLIAVIMFALLFLLTGSIVVPLKALVLNMLSLTAAFGALVWIFQDGHLSGLGTTPTGTLVANMPVLLFCIAFGLSMDYEVFLVSRIREFWLETGDSDESVALGIAHTGRVITAAALIMSISFAALIAASVSFMRMFGLGLTLAVLVDATLVRMVLVPAFMHLMGGLNWWAPGWLRRVHERLGFTEAPSVNPEVTPPERISSP
ncbi:MULTISPECIES: MMPL family transporter [Mycolicibacterium]|uniref:MMPL family transporter n=1 Tax=Mycolicibacterium austroafricanum TaxID=39687 RepID=A0ABT8HA17_MYCAO|nr:MULTISPECIES: MMPL family transporter [Mycolicibacterium]MDN4517606.1 MMPL family transporter [Mycolicibacterium austroafricanum]MDW5613778.1 MMPL family transporter [Mycolicibacterium sp. D5.8-2]QRZ09762.1 MMPL family transporter [Mycolicibacterium austroafricanum]QZT59824.1 MMPL family transporter [Mycolicibacterium austroafricanum]QZT71212.1 MMPL family transporter [Mycolicibacterium austroafricanum]